MLRMKILALACLLALVSSTTNGHQSYGYGSYFPHYSPLPFDQRSNPLLYPDATSPQSMMDEGSLQARGVGVISMLLLSQITTRLVQLEEMVINMGNTNGQGTTDELESLKLKLAKIKSSQTNLEQTVTASSIALSSIQSNLTLLETSVNATTSGLTSVQFNQMYLEGNVTGTTSDLTAVKNSLIYLDGNLTASTVELSTIKSNLTLLETTVNATASDLTTVLLNQTYLEGNLTVTTNEQAGIKLNVTYLQGNSTSTGMSAGTSIGGIPTSCQDLMKLGNTKNGIYNIKADSKVAMVYCDFTKAVTDADFEKQIGYAEVKTEPVYFYAEMLQYMQGQDFDTPIIFGSATVNVGDVFDLTDSKFTAPCDGIYFLSFTSTVGFGQAFTGVKNTAVSLRVDDKFVASASISASSPGSNLSGQIHLDRILSLRKGSKVGLVFYAPNGIYLDSNQKTFFHGMLLHEDLFPSMRVVD